MLILDPRWWPNDGCWLCRGGARRACSSDEDAEVTPWGIKSPLFLSLLFPHPVPSKSIFAPNLQKDVSILGCGLGSSGQRRLSRWKDNPLLSPATGSIPDPAPAQILDPTTTNQSLRSPPGAVAAAAVTAQGRPAQGRGGHLGQMVLTAQFMQSQHADSSP